MDRIFRHLGPVLAQVNKTLYTVLYGGPALSFIFLEIL